MDYSPAGSSVHDILQARILEWVASSSSRGLPQPETEPASPALAGRFFLPPSHLGSPIWKTTFKYEQWLNRWPQVYRTKGDQGGEEAPSGYEARRNEITSHGGKGCMTAGGWQDEF